MSAAQLVDQFESHRTHLLAVGYRLTGSVSDAEDAVQESWLRLAGTDPAEVRDLRGWLTTVVSRICLDRLRSAAQRRESYIGQWLPEPVVTPVASAAAPDPLESVVHHEDNRFAAMVVLDTLTAPQRVAFVLHDGFGVPFEEVAEILGVTAASARQLASRARRSVHTDTAAAPALSQEHEQAVERLVAALATADLETIVAALHPDSLVVGDAGGTTRVALNVVTGPDRVARFFLGLQTKYGPLFETAIPVMVNGMLGLLIPETPDRPRHVLGFLVREGKVAGIYDVANPAKLTGIRL
ncbi:MAG: sigma-70 family RNA polymerase sigma factor [Mycobacteriaceae bacterium]|nr:sigma-70 family RNA polymerase sigma factor [Mycobacteriaceae bacterium]